MKLLVVGDVHGCYYTLKTLVKENWDPENEYLIQLGDLINKGPNTIKCIKYWRKLQKKHGDKVVLLRGNHEQMFVDFFEKDQNNRFVNQLIYELVENEIKTEKILKWLQETPIKWKNKDVFVSHAGVNKYAKHPLKASDPHGVLYNRSSLKNIGRVQITGHNIVDGHKPHFNSRENAWHIDTGAWIKRYLSAIKIDEDGQNAQVIRVKRDAQDKAKNQGRKTA